MKKILVVQTAKLGDMVCTTPVFREIKLKYPESDVYVLGDSINKGVLEGNPHITGYLELKYLSLKKIKELEIDIAVLLNPNPSVLLHLLLSGISKIITPKIVGGYSPYATKTYRILSLFTTRVPHRFFHYAPQEYLNMLEPIGIESNNTKKDLYFSKEAESKVESLLSIYTGKKIAVSPSAGNKIKNWGGKNFAKIADEVYKRWGLSVFVIGGPRDKDEVREMLENLSPDIKVIDMSMKLSIDELKAFMSKMDIFVAVDTGPIYIAEAFGVSTVDIIGPMDEREQPPVGPKHRVIYIKARKAPALHIMNARMYDEKEARRQIEEITPEMVISEIDNIIQST